MLQLKAFKTILDRNRKYENLMINKQISIQINTIFKESYQY